MKNHYTLARMFLAVALMANIIASKAQHPLEFLNANNVNAGFGIGGNLFTKMDSGTTAQFGLLEVPRGSDMRTMFTSGLWLSGYDAGGNLKGAAQRYQQGGADFFDGPVSSTYNAAYDNFYKRVFKITRTQIAHHQSLGFFNVLVGQVDSAILFWPAKGNPYVSVSYGVDIDNRLAPFVDVDGDGWYDPCHGDYPDVCGEEAVFFVFNDDRAAHLETGCAKLAVEIRGLAEVFLDTSFGGFNAPPPAKRAINNTVFVHYEIENKSVNPLYDFYTALFEDVDLGCFTNDRVGCDTNKNLMFVYNGSIPDPDCAGTTGYGQFRVASGTKFLNADLNAFGYFTNGASFAQTDPANCAQYRNYETGHWNDGTPFNQGGTGYGGSTPSTTIIFPGDPGNQNDWSEMQPATAAVLPAGDRRMFGSSALGLFSAGETKIFDLAFTTSFDSTVTNLAIIDTLKRDADLMQTFYHNQILPCRSHQNVGLGNMVKDELQVSVFPNPASGLLFIETGTVVDAVELTDVLGRTVISKVPDAKKLSVDVSMLAHGVYLLRIKAGEQTAVKKIVVGQ